MNVGHAETAFRNDTVGGLYNFQYQASLLSIKSCLIRNNNRIVIY